MTPDDSLPPRTAAEVPTNLDKVGPTRAGQALVDANVPTAPHLLSQVLMAKGFKAAAHAIVNDVARAMDIGERGGRVSLVWRERSETSVVAATHLDLADRHSDTHRAIAGAGEEALDQGLPLAANGQGSHPASAKAITREQSALARLGAAWVISLPFGVDGSGLGALVMETTDPALVGLNKSEDALALGLGLHEWSAALTLCAPVLRLLQEREQPWWQKARRHVAAAWDRLRQPAHGRWRQGLAVVAMVLAVLALWPMDAKVSGLARIEGAEQRVLVAPTDGFLKAAPARPGDAVSEGETVVELMERDFQLERDRWASQLAQHESAYAASMARADRGAAAMNLARAQEAQAQLDLVDEQLVRSRLTAPFDAVVIQGDLSQSIGAPVRQGDVLLTLATKGRLRVVIDIDEVDIAAVQVGQVGGLHLSALPWDQQDLVIERITPLGKSVEGRQVMEVQARLVQEGLTLRPGLQGHASIVTGRQAPLWVWGGKLARRAKLLWWRGT